MHTLRSLSQLISCSVLLITLAKISLCHSKSDDKDSHLRDLSSTESAVVQNNRPNIFLSHSSSSTAKSNRIIKKGCCSHNFKNCDADWCGHTKEKCLSCGPKGSKTWLPFGRPVPNDNCVARWGECTNNVDGCCHPATCVRKNKWYSQCLSKEEDEDDDETTTSPLPSPTPNPTGRPTNAPTRTPTAAPTRTPTATPTDASSSNTGGCCSQNFRSCDVYWCGDTKAQCLSCGPSGSKIWLPDGALDDNEKCLARWKECTNNVEGCCAPAVCMKRNPWYSQCRLPPDSTSMPTSAPTSTPTSTPTNAPTNEPTTALTSTPTSTSTRAPIRAPTGEPTISPMSTPVTLPTVAPTSTPTKAPTSAPTDAPTSTPTSVPTDAPTSNPTIAPTREPTSTPTSAPTLSPTKNTPEPTSKPTSKPTSVTPSPTDTPTFTNDAEIVTAEESSENVVIPDPPEPTDDRVGDDRTECPHLANNLLDWHDPVTWGGIGPTSGDVALPSNSKVVVRRTIDGNLGTITVPTSSELIIGENEAGIQISSTGIDVQGALRAGSETCRIETPIEITLRGTRPADATTNPPDTARKGISVTGILDFHGKRYYRTWTRLAKTAEPGDRSLFLQHAVNWEPGQRVVLVTTAMKDSREWHRNEELTVDELSESAPPGVGAVVRLQSPVVYEHVAIRRGYQAEVGLLSRTITVRGDAHDSEPTDPDSGDCTGSKSYYGDRSVPCPNRNLTGYGGHIIVHNGGRGYVEGIELERMGQTNVLGRYPMHFHLLGDGCRDCYFRDSSVHHSFYRCVSIHGTNSLSVTENVAYDVVGYCYYLEDGVEEKNTISFNLAAHVHMIGDPATGSGQTTPLAYQSSDLTLPADVTASGFYITNVHNNVVGNAASGGWAGFAFPTLRAPIGLHRTVNMRPSSKTTLSIDGNTAHSSGWWWYHAGTFYFGGSLYYEGDRLVYNAGRDTSRTRSPCLVDHCTVSNNCNRYCQPEEQAWLRVTNTKTFAAPSVGLNSWSGRAEIVGFEAHDVGLTLEALESGFWIDDLLAVCRSGTKLQLPPNADAPRLKGDGFFWYDTNQEHIITNAVFRNCGYRSAVYDQYDDSADRGCGDSNENGCQSSSTVFGFLTHSDQFTPEIMQATRNVRFENCGRRFRLHDYRGTDRPSTVSGRGQNWLDVDGSVSGLGEPTLIGSGLSDAGSWWRADPNAVHDPQGPLEFVPRNSGGPNHRALGHVRLAWDDAVHDEVGGPVCTNGGGQPCPALGRMRHFGPLFDEDQGLPVTANPDVAGLTGGFGWRLELDQGAPRTLRVNLIEASPTSPLVLGAAWPLGTTFKIVAHAAYCSNSDRYSCEETFTAVSSAADVRRSLGNVYHVDTATGFMTVRIVQTPQSFVGAPEWILPDYETVGKWGRGYALPRFERGGVRLPILSYGPYLEIRADCERGTGDRAAFCAESPLANVSPPVCSPGYEQIAYDKCCKTNEPSVCEYA